MVSALTGMSMSVVVGSIMQRSAVRKILDLPPLPANPPKLPTLMESRDAMYKYFQDQAKAAEKQTKNDNPKGRRR
jgi:hypothetical protein